MSKESGRTSAILMCSAEALRMYNVLCSGAKEENETGVKQKKNKIKDFSSRTPAFYLAAAIGIINDRTGTIAKEKELSRREYIVEHTNFDPFAQLLKSKYNLKSEQEVIDKLLEFQEFGIRELFDESHKSGKIDFLRIYRDAKSRT